jgi:biopolymer transport protein ExbD
MKYEAKKEFGKAPEVDYTPMIDMTFQLIAFFMFTLSFSDNVVNERVLLPDSELAKPPESPPEKPLTLQLAVWKTRPNPMNPAGERLPEARVIMASGDVSIDELAKHLNNEREFRKRSGMKEEEIKETPIIIRADAEAKTGDVQRLIKVCQEAQFEKFVLRAKERGT